MSADALLLTGTSVIGTPGANALGVAGGRIVAIGRRSDVLRRMPSGIRTVDVPGGVLSPGLIDSHCHVEDAAMDSYTVALITAETIDDALHAVAAFADGRPGDAWVRGRTWNPLLQLRERRAPTRHELDDAAGGRPVLLPEAHGASASTAALRAAGIDPQGHDGRFDRAGLDHLLTVVPEWSDEDRRAQLLAAMRVLNRHGITSVVAGATTPRDLTLLRALADAGRSTARVAVMAMPSGSLNPDVTDNEWDRLLGTVPTHRDRWLSVRGVKLQIDGGMTLGTAWTRADYLSRPGYRGVTVTSPDILRARVAAAHAHGLPVGVHVVGDAAIDLALAVLGAGDGCAPDVLVHASLMTPDQITRAADTGVVIAAQIPFLWRNTPVIREHFGEAVTRRAIPFRDWVDVLGLDRVAAGTDHPVNDLNPFASLYAMSERRDESGAEIGAAQRVTRAEAFALHTASGAAHMGESAYTGRLAEGRLADIAVFDRDPLTCPPAELLDTHVHLTVVGGRIVHDARTPATR
ncbi:amidohydrolase [Nocardia fusca]|uniref:amidohydrolase n=1 Tax=Nocardia fusca TaxID=941183 RepID=UPI0037936A77